MDVDMTLGVTQVWPPQYYWHHRQTMPNYTPDNYHYWPPNFMPIRNRQTSRYLPPVQLSAHTNTFYPWWLSMWTMGLVRQQTREDFGRYTREKKFQPRESFVEMFKWKTVDIAYPNEEMKSLALKSGKYKPANILPLGLQVFNNRVFVSLPQWKDGVPVTLATFNINSGSSPSMEPYPNWSWHSNRDCRGLTSVFRMDIDSCQRMWVLDSGVTDVESSVNQTCPPQIFVFNLATDRLLKRYVIPSDQYLDSSLLSNIVVEVVNGNCGDTYAYLGDVFRYGIVVYSLRTHTSWRVTHAYFYPDPLAADYNLNGIQFQWVDGIFGMALSPADAKGIRKLYFHPLSSFREFSVPTYILRNSTIGFDMNEFYKVVGEPRGYEVSHSTGSAFDRNGVMFYNLLTKSGVACWNSNLGVYDPSTQYLLYQNNGTLSFPNDLRVDQAEPEQNVWVLSNKLHIFLYGKLNRNDFNFRILRAKSSQVVRGTICDPNLTPSLQTLKSMKLRTAESESRRVH